MGANVGDREAALERAVRWLDATPGLTTQARSSWRRTRPLGPPQPDFLNGVVRVTTDLAPFPLLHVLLTLERAAGRVRRGHWGPRTLDLDLLLVDDVVMQTTTLTLPHPGLATRRFALAPICELDPLLIHPTLDCAMSDLLEALPR